MKRITWFIIIILCIAACKDAMVIPSDTEQKRMPSIELRIASDSIVTYSTATANECWINKLWVLEFNGNTLENMQLIDGADIFHNGSAVQILPQLDVMPQDGNTIVCIANSDAVTDPHPNMSSINRSNLNTYFPIIAKAFHTETDALPMFGYINDWGNTNSSYTCEMTRAVAKIQLQMGESVEDVTGNFSPETVTYTVYNSAISGLIEPQSAPYGTTSPVSHHSAAFNLLQKSSPANTNVYIHEFASATTLGVGGGTIDQDTFDEDRQHIILTKVSGADTRYFRLDFINPLTNRFLDTERNFHYLFTINKVRSEGYVDLLQAQKNPGSNIEYTINVSDGNQPKATRIISNGQYAILVEGSFEGDSISFSGLSGTVAKIGDLNAGYQLPPQMSSLAPGTLNAITVATYTPSASPTAFTLLNPNTLDIIPSSSGFEVLVENGTLPGTVGVITFYLGNMTYKIYIKYMG